MKKIRWLYTVRQKVYCSAVETYAIIYLSLAISVVDGNQMEQGSSPLTRAAAWSRALLGAGGLLQLLL